MTPVDAAYAGAEFEAANKMVPISRKIDAETSVIFFKNYTRILVLLYCPLSQYVQSYFRIFPKFSTMRSR